MTSNEYASLHEDSFKRIFEMYRKRIYGYALTLSRSSYAAEEITQNIFIKLWLCRDTLEGVENLDSYIFSMAHNKTLNYLRKASNDANLMRSSQVYRDTSNNNVEERLITYDYHHLIEEAVQTLTPQRRIVYQLSRADGLKNEEIAAYLHISHNTVRNHLVEALKSIRRYIISKGSIGILLTCLLAG
ncbi:MAG: RNA polymerase sigma-70 factor [Flavitalea sp.]